VPFPNRVKIKVKGNGRECLVHTCWASLRSADSRGGCLYVVRSAACKQQVPPLRRRCRSGSGRNDKAFGETLYAALKRRSSTVLQVFVARLKVVTFPNRVKIKVKGNGRECLVHTCRCRFALLTAEDGCRYMSCGAACKQRVPPLRRRCRSVSGRNDKVFGKTLYAALKRRSSTVLQALRHDCRSCPSRTFLPDKARSRIRGKGDVKNGATGVRGSHFSQRTREMGHPRLIRVLSKSRSKATDRSVWSTLAGRRFAPLTAEDGCRYMSCGSRGDGEGSDVRIPRKLPAGLMPVQAGMGSFDCASHWLRQCLASLRMTAW
jgi:hypothetical protein